MKINRMPGVKELTDINLREFANDINAVLTKHVGGKLWTEVVMFTRVPKSGGGFHRDEWNITLKVDDMEIISRSDKPSIFDDSWQTEPALSEQAG